MKKELKDKFPNWCFMAQPLAVTLTNDIDSLVGCAIEQKVNGNQINYFYDFDNVYKMDKNVQKPSLGIDLALTYGKCWDNHVTRINKDSKVNPNSANINSILNISGDNYFDKYAGSTALLMWSFYDLPLPKTKEGKMLLLSIDSSFLGHYDDRFKEVHNEYLELLGFEELIDLLNDTNKQDYYDLIREYKLSSDIQIDENGYLLTDLPIEMLSEALNLQLDLPLQPFHLQTQYTNKYGTVKGNESGRLKPNVISFALTNKRFYKYTVKDTKEIKI
ncbi:hypothetical protein [Lentibacillus amyloliquefaciens]|uniref:Uncharacterized protein n=1 Tax=Lentibacillus amyloliquefaciens TaxID=1472767 RepID=A0A0U4FJC1_9BACI|nr:hypothetical protein [Lentibacillus amyloliquefaciens]ALX47860.1 hypothetical protein AOX59_04125 [Lentibacillus amyloliquefaciens]